MYVEGNPPRLAAVIVNGSKDMRYTDYAPPTSLMKIFVQRSDAQIMGLELLALALGLCTFSSVCRNRKVRTFSDNCSAEASVVRGSAKTWDHNAIVHAIWVKAAEISAHLHVERVPTEVSNSRARGLWCVFMCASTLTGQYCRSPIAIAMRPFETAGSERGATSVRRQVLET